ncbi:MAG: hypothetical protein ABIT38_21595 [Gemmatimonadaceae bacterium]
MHLRLSPLASLLAIGCASGASPSPQRAASPVTTASSSTSAPAEANLSARITHLKQSFSCTDVPSASTFVCTMKDGISGSLVRKRIEPVVTGTGTIFLRTVYRDRDWIYHDHVVVHVGDAVISSDVLPASSPNVSRREVRRSGRDRNGNRDDYVDEMLSYRNGGDNGIIRSVAESGSSIVTMQLTGGPRSFEKTLSDDEKRLFAEAFELARLLQASGGGRPLVDDNHP